jgi:hypothetical protein
VDVEFVKEWRASEKLVHAGADEAADEAPGQIATEAGEGGRGHDAVAEPRGHDDQQSERAISVAVRHSGGILVRCLMHHRDTEKREERREKREERREKREERGERKSSSAAPTCTTIALEDSLIVGVEGRGPRQSRSIASEIVHMSTQATNPPLRDLVTSDAPLLRFFGVAPELFTCVACGVPRACHATEFCGEADCGDAVGIEHGGDAGIIGAEFEDFDAGAFGEGLCGGDDSATHPLIA